VRGERGGEPSDARPVGGLTELLQCVPAVIKLGESGVEAVREVVVAEVPGVAE